MLFAITSVVAGIVLLAAAMRAKWLDRYPESRFGRSLLAVAGLLSLLIGLFWALDGTELESDALTRATYLTTGGVTACFLLLMGIYLVRLARAAEDRPGEVDISLPPVAVRMSGYASLVGSCVAVILALLFTALSP